MKNSNIAIERKEYLEKKGFLVGAIRPPTVKKAILRVILRTNIQIEKINYFLDILDN